MTIDAAEDSLARTALCLLTFESLPFLPLAIDAPVQATLNRLTEQGVLLENFYLQQQGGEYFASHLPQDAEIFVEVDPAAARQRLRQVLDSAVEPTERTPESPAALTWIHIPDSVGMDDCDEALTQLVADIAAATDRSSISVIVTAVEGTCPVDLSPFESLLWESEVRVPCWAFVPNQVPGRCQKLIGSDALLQGISEQQLPDEITGRSGAAAMDATEPPETRLLLKTERVLAVRDPQFLFVCEHAEDDSDEPATFAAEPATALYAKPEDVWNVNDVAAEFLADSERLFDELQRPAAQ